MSEEKEKCGYFRPASGKMWCALGWCPCIKKKDKNQLCLYFTTVEEWEKKRDEETETVSAEDDR